MFFDQVSDFVGGYQTHLPTSLQKSFSTKQKDRKGQAHFTLLL